MPAPARSSMPSTRPTSPSGSSPTRSTPSISGGCERGRAAVRRADPLPGPGRGGCGHDLGLSRRRRSEEHTSELQSRLHLVCRLLLEKKKKDTKNIKTHDV